MTNTKNQGLALVTGGSGLWGKKICLSLLRKGYKVIALSRTVPGELIEWAQAQNQSFQHIAFDLENPNWQLIEQLQDIDVYFHASASFDENLEKMFKVNVLNSIKLIELVAKSMKAKSYGRIGVLLGQNGRVGMPGLAAFSASQGALWTWSEAKYREFKSLKENLSLTMIFPNRAASKLQAKLAKALNKTVKVKIPKNADSLVESVLAAKKSTGRKPFLAAINTLIT